MKGTRAASLAAVTATLLALAVEPVAAQAAADSTTESLIRALNRQLLYIAIPITVLVEAILFYTVWRFRGNESPLPTRENRRLEITWTVATALILLFVGVASYQVLAQPWVAATSSDVGEGLDGEQDPLDVQVIGETYQWTYVYPAANVSTTDTMVLPTDRPIRFNVTSRDWLHSMHVPELGLKQDAFPGQPNYLLTEISSTGEYQLYCAEYCGVGHSDMLGTVDVRSQSEFRAWLDETGSGATTGETNRTASGTNETASGTNETTAGTETAAANETAAAIDTTATNVAGASSAFDGPTEVSREAPSPT